MNLSISNLTKSFQKNIRILEGVNLELGAGKKSAIIGRSGSGKSTLLSIIAGLESFDQGEVIFGDKKYSRMSVEELSLLRRDNIGFIFQQFHLIPHLTALENVALTGLIKKMPDAMERARNFLHQVGLDDRAGAYPSTLSGGEKQRVAIARALAHDPKFLLLDEPTGSLDEKTGNEVMDLVFDLAARLKMSFLLVTHSRELAGRCDEIFTLEHGVLKST